jgi:threonine/homoserine/homoserine lactone efflux protein
MDRVLPVWAFVAVTVPLVLVPGVSTAVVFRNSIAGGVRAGLETAVGVNAGSLCYGLLSAFGMALAIQRWPPVWLALRGLGAAYIAWLGARSVYHALRGSAPRPVVAGVSGRTTFDHAYEGFLTNALNPSIASFYLLIVPQFVPRDASVARSVLILTAIHVALAISWHAVWASAGGTLSHVLADGKPRAAIELLAGAALLALALKIALG